MRKRYLACVLVSVAVAPVLMGHQSAAAASLRDCTGEHTYTFPGNAIAPVFGVNMADSWNETCAVIDTSAAPFGAVTVNPFTSSAAPLYSGDCGFGFSDSPNNGVRLFIGPAVVAVGESGTAADATVGVLGVPSTVPCTGGTISWSGAETALGTP